MKTHHLLSFILFFCWVIPTSFAQNDLPPNIKRAIDEFLSSSLFIDVAEMGEDAESRAKMIKGGQSQLTSYELMTLQNGYNNTRVRMKSFLDKIKLDFSNPKTRKEISENTERYKYELNGRFNEVKDYYYRNFKQPSTEAAAKYGWFGASPLLLLLTPENLTQIVKIISGIFSAMAQQRQQVQAAVGAYLEEKLISEYKMKTWDEIQVEVNPVSPTEDQNVPPDSSNLEEMKGVDDVKTQNEALRTPSTDVKNLPNTTNPKTTTQNDDNPANDVKKIEMIDPNKAKAGTPKPPTSAPKKTSTAPVKKENG